MNDLPDDSEPENGVVQVEDASRQSSILAKWLTLFLLRMQVVHRMSDVAISCFLKFLWAFFNILGSFSSICVEITKVFPSSLCKAKSIITKPKIKQYVVCRKCHTLYFKMDCMFGIGAAQIGKKCFFKRFPSHPQHRMRKPCGIPLLKTVELAGGKRILYPYMIYSYLSIESSIQAMFNRPKFHLECEEWRSRKISSDVYTDVYDGKVWKEYLRSGFLSELHNLAFMLNFDFFQPYKHVQHSVGALYLTVMNLPRSKRYKQENVILVSLIPGPHEPKHDINSYIKPLVDELLRFWNGINLSIHSISGKKSVRCALLCVACDLPAGRKLCGFPSFTARYGCSRCLKKFRGSVGSMDYSGFDRNQWPPRSGTTHRRVAISLKNFKTKSQQLNEEFNSGCKYSDLLRLPYFDAPRMLVVDPMHNLFLGTAKHYLKSIWLEEGIVSGSNFEVIQQHVDSATVPAGIGRIPSKILSGFSSFTADQWKNWVNYFCLICLQDHLQGDDLECWRHFVLACRILSKYTLSTNDILLADALILQFCKRTERQYGKSKITPNMHMHCHLRSCIEDYGPLHGFWLFAFERYNGILGSIPNNNRSIEVQMMRRFVTDGLICNLEIPSEFREDLEVHFLNPDRCNVAGTLADVTLGSTVQQSMQSTNSAYTLSSDIVLPSYRSRYSFCDEEIGEVKHLLCKLYSIDSSVIQVSRNCFKYKTIQFQGKQLGSHFSRSKASSIVMALWKSDIFGYPSTDLEDSELLRAARINYFLLNTSFINDDSYTLMFVCLSWYCCHPKMRSFGKPLSIWYHNFELFNSIIPIRFVQHRTISLSSYIDNRSVLVVCPCVEF